MERRQCRFMLGSNERGSGTIAPSPCFEPKSDPQ